MSDQAHKIKPTVLVTGANGFVGRYLSRALLDQFAGQVDIVETSRKQDVDTSATGRATVVLDVTDADAIADVVRTYRPTHVINLAGIASVNAANADPAKSWQVHVFGALNIANALKANAPDAVLISVGTGQVYGASARHVAVLDESTVLTPTNVYEVTKAAGDLALGAMVEQGLRCIRMRPFNHIGPGQTEDFVVPSFAMQVARIEAGLQSSVLRVGNLEAERDFLDVRDVARAYALAVAKADQIPTGTILNLASGTPIRISSILDKMLAQSRVPITVQQDPARMRPSDTPRYVGSAARARTLLDWTPIHSIEDTLKTVLEHSRYRVRASA
jgi:GDP-4-dehydro-6-deoxy-D-mannose reductase